MGFGCGDVRPCPFMGRMSTPKTLEVGLMVGCNLVGTSQITSLLTLAQLWFERCHNYRIFPTNGPFQH